MKKYAKRLNNTVFDLAAPPTLLRFMLGKYSLQLFLIVAVPILIFVTVKLIKRAKKKESQR